VKAALAILAAAAWAWFWAPPPASAGELDGGEIADYRVWRSTRCYKPPPPAVQISDALSYNLAVDAFNRYFEQIKAFMQCIGAEANGDYEAMRKVLETGLDRARAEALEDLERTRSAIESYGAAVGGAGLSAAPPR